MPLLTILECKPSGDGASPSADNSLCNTMPNTAGNIEKPSCDSMNNFQTSQAQPHSAHARTSAAQKITRKDSLQRTASNWQGFWKNTYDAYFILNASSYSRAGEPMARTF